MSQVANIRNHWKKLIRTIGTMAWMWGGPALADSARWVPEFADGRTDVVEVRATWQDDEGRIAWRTGVAWGTAGFRVIRIDAQTGLETVLNEVLVPVAFHDPSATYSVADPAAVAGGTGRYRLEETTQAGETNDLGTFAVEFAPPPKTARTPAPKAALPLFFM